MFYLVLYVQQIWNIDLVTPALMSEFPITFSWEFWFDSYILFCPDVVCREFIDQREIWLWFNLVTVELKSRIDM